MVVLVYKVINIMNLDESFESNQRSAAISWSVTTVIIVLIFHVKIITKYIFQNNLVGVLKSDPKYGPPELEDRKRRRNFNELYHSRQCKHECLIIDEKYKCNHLPLIFKDHLTSEPTSASSLTNLYDAGPSKKRASSVIDPSILHLN